MPVTRLSRLANFGGTMMWFLAWLCVTGSVLEGCCHSCWRGRSFNDTGQWVQPPHVTRWWCWYVQDVNTNKHIKHKSWKVATKGETTCTHTVHAQDRSLPFLSGVKTESLCKAKSRCNKPSVRDTPWQSASLRGRSWKKICVNRLWLC